MAASTLSETLLGDSISANLLMLGYAWQRGVIPLALGSIERAIELNEKNVQSNLRAFAAGRLATINERPAAEAPLTSQDFIARRTADLRLYWNEAYARRYADLLAVVQGAAERIEGGETFVWAVARSAYKLMAYKDEYEVARLYSDGRFRQALAREFERTRTVRIHLASPLLARIDPLTGRPRKMTFGAWILPVFRAMAAMKGLREGPIDVFARSAERRLERTLRDTYMSVLRKLSATLSAQSLSDAVALAQAPLDVRGFGPVKAQAAEALLLRLRALT